MIWMYIEGILLPDQKSGSVMNIISLKNVTVTFSATLPWP